MPSRTTRQEPDLVRRDNGYSVVTPEPTSGDNALGIYQDGTDFCYFVEVGLGSDGKSLYMLLDTGAGTSWVMGSDCTSAPCKVHNSFGSSDSKTFKESSKGFSIAYGSGTVKGNLVEDTISLAGLNVPMTFGVANETSDDFNHFPFDGILGLSMTTGATDNFVQTVKNAKTLQSNLFSVSLSRHSDGVNNGEIIFGGTNPSKFTGSISYTDLAPKAGKDWAITMDKISYDGTSAGAEGRTAYIDTGTSYVFGPPDDVAALHKLIPGAESADGVTYTVPCKNDVPITVSFSGVSYDISPRDWHSSPNGDKCTSNIYGHAVVPDAWLLGDLFLKNVYTVFDADQERIGFASEPVVSTKPTATTATAGGTKATAPSASEPTDGTTGSPASGASNSPLPGLTGQETSVVTEGAPAAQTSAASPTSTMKSPAEQLERSNYVSIIGAVAIVAMVA